MDKPADKSRPLLTNAARPATFEVEAYNELGEMVPTSIAGEHPLTLYVDKREIVTLMTLGHAPEALAIGYLRNQRLVAAIDDVVAVQVDWETESVAVTTTKKTDIRQKIAKKISVVLANGKPDFEWSVPVKLRIPESCPMQDAGKLIYTLQDMKLLRTKYAADPVKK